MWWRAFPILVVVAASSQPLPEYTVEKLIGGQSYVSAVSWSKDGYLLLADLPSGNITKVGAQGSSKFREGLQASGLAWDSEGRLLVCDPHSRNVVRIDKRDKVEILADRYEGKRLNGPDSLVIAKNNQIWFTDPAFGSADKARELPFYGVYHLSSRGDLTLAARTGGRPNGIALSSDGRLLYVVDSDARTVLAWDVDRAGVLTNSRVLARVTEGVPTGLTAAPDGRLFVTARSIEVFTKDGKPLGKIEIAEKPAGVAFGEGESSMFVAARTSVYRVRFRKGEKSE